jgi:hypothetical protein
MPLQIKRSEVEAAPTRSRASGLKQPKVVFFAKMGKAATATMHGIDLAMRSMAFRRAVGGGSSEQVNEFSLMNDCLGG